MSQIANTPPLRPLETAGTVPPDLRTEQLKEVAQDFEAVFIAQMLASLTSDLEGEGPLGGTSNDPFRQMLGQELAKVISRAGGIGVSDAVLKEMLKLQEVV